LWRTLIIGALAALLSVLGGCSALRLGYGQAPELVFWWVDGYVDLDDEQSAQARDAIRQWFRWHRTTQLDDYATVLSRMQGELAEPSSAGRMCRLAEQLRSRMDIAFDQAVPAVAEIARTLTPQQIEHLRRKHAKNNADYRRGYLQADAQERRGAQAKRIVDRAETLYGRLDDAQRERVAQWVAESPFDPQRWFDERRLRQQDVLELLTRLSGDDPPPAQAQAAIRRVYEDAFRSPREAYRGYQQRLGDHNCAFAAQVHNLTTPEQRRRAAERLKGWEDDLRALATQAP